MSDACRESGAPPQFLDTERDRALARLASRRQGLVTTRQLAALGFDANAIAERVAAGRLHRLFQGVYAVGHTALSRQGQLVAATLACGPGTVVSHRTAGHVWAMNRFSSSVIDVTVPSTNGRTDHPGLHIHRTSRLQKSETTNRAGVPITTPARTLVDLAAIQPIERALHLALAGRLIEAQTLRAYLADTGRRPGIVALREALADAHPEVHRTRSELERAALRLIGKARLPDPRVNHLRAEKELDLVWDRDRVVVELDGYGHHRSAASLNADLRRANDLEAAGWKVRRFTWAHLCDDPGWVIETIRGALGR